MDIERNRRPVRGISLTPLIDVMFFLIVFFMMSTSFVMSKSMELNLPSQQGKNKHGEGKASKDDAMLLRVQPDGAVTVAGKFYSLEALGPRLKEVLAAKPDQRFMILSTENVSVQQLVTVMDAIYLLGGKSVQIDRDGHDVGFDVKIENYDPKVQ